MHFRSQKREPSVYQDAPVPSRKNHPILSGETSAAGAEPPRRRNSHHRRVTGGGLPPSDPTPDEDSLIFLYGGEQNPGKPKITSSSRWGGAPTRRGAERPPLERPTRLCTTIKSECNE
jgi:hypothetical protein